MVIKNTKLREAEEPVIKVKPELQPVNAMVSNLIKREWETVDICNGELQLAQEMKDSVLAGVISDILSDAYIHIGQLEGALLKSAPESDAIDDAKDEVEDVVEDEVEDEPAKKEKDTEDAELPSDDIDIDAVDSVDFDKAEEEEEK